MSHFLSTGITLAILKSSGTVPVLKEQLNNNSRGLDKVHLSSLRILIGILKGPTAFPILSSDIIFSISSEVIGGFQYDAIVYILPH